MIEIRDYGETFRLAGRATFDPVYINYDGDMKVGELIDDIIIKIISLPKDASYRVIHIEQASRFTPYYRGRPIEESDKLNETDIKSEDRRRLYIMHGDSVVKP